MLGKIQKKHCPQVPKKLSYLKSLEIQKPQLILNIFTPATTGNGFFYQTSLSNSRWKNCKKRPNRFRTTEIWSIKLL